MELGGEEGLEAVGQALVEPLEEKERDEREEERSGGEGGGAELVGDGAALAVGGDGVDDDLFAFGEELGARAVFGGGVFLGDGEDVGAAEEEDAFGVAVEFADVGQTAAIVGGDVEEVFLDVAGPFSGGEFGAGGLDDPELLALEDNGGGWLGVGRDGGCHEQQSGEGFYHSICRISVFERILR